MIRTAALKQRRTSAPDPTDLKQLVKPRQQPARVKLINTFSPNCCVEIVVPSGPSANDSHLQIGRDWITCRITGKQPIG